MDGEEARNSKNYRASKAGRGHDEKANKSGKEGQYMNQEISNLCRFISVIKLRPIMWRQNHPYLLVDKVKDLTDPEELSKNKKTDRTVALYGFSRGAHMNPSYSVHIAGVGDFAPSSVTHLSDPAQLSKEQKNAR